MNRQNLINQLANDANIHFYTFEQDDDTIIAKSHFFDIHFETDGIKIVDSYVLPGLKFKQYLDKNLPLTLQYNVDNFYQIMLEYVEELVTHCLYFERQDEIEAER